MNFPLVSIAIVTYNQKDFLRDCIESCLSQDYPNFEIVVADDGSTDGTQVMLTNYRTKYPQKFKIILSSTNQGITQNCNLVHFACTGKYVAWMGGDDIMLPNKINRQVSYMESHDNCSICYHNLEVFDSLTNNTIDYFNRRLKYSGDVRVSIRKGTFNGACSTFVRREKTPLSGFNVSLPVASDWLYWVETLVSGGTIEYIDEVLGRYRRHSKNVSQVGNLISQGELDMFSSCQIIMCKYPQYFSEVICNYSDRLILG
jgi:glycosyltransferase involved in cell wall biosynthesis